MAGSKEDNRAEGDLGTSYQYLVVLAKVSVTIIGYRNLILQSGTNTKSLAGVILLLKEIAHAPKSFWQCPEPTYPCGHASSSHQRVCSQMWKEVKSHLLMLLRPFAVLKTLHASQTWEMSRLHNSSGVS